MSAANEDASHGSTKRKRGVEDDLVCPLTMELPFDPVTAADGIVYERKAIQEYFQSKPKGKKLKSPVTKEPLKSKDLLDAPQHKKAVDALVTNGVIFGDLAKKWYAAKNRALVKRAEDGNIDAAVFVANHYIGGICGFEQDFKEGLRWACKAHEAGDARGTYYISQAFLKGEGVEKNPQQGVMYLSMASKESDFASYFLGQALAHGKYGLKIDYTEAIRQFEHLLNGKCKHNFLGEDMRDGAKRLLAQLKQLAQGYGRTVLQE